MINLDVNASYDNVTSYDHDMMCEDAIGKRVTQLLMKQPYRYTCYFTSSASEGLTTVIAHINLPIHGQPHDHPCVKLICERYNIAYSTEKGKIMLDTLIDSRTGEMYPTRGISIVDATGAVGKINLHDLIKHSPIAVIFNASKILPVGNTSLTGLACMILRDDWKIKPLIPGVGRFRAGRTCMLQLDELSDRLYQPIVTNKDTYYTVVEYLNSHNIKYTIPTKPHLFSTILIPMVDACTKRGKMLTLGYRVGSPFRCTNHNGYIRISWSPHEPVDNILSCLSKL